MVSIERSAQLTEEIYEDAESKFLSKFVRRIYLPEKDLYVELYPYRSSKSESSDELGNIKVHRNYNGHIKLDSIKNILKEKDVHYSTSGNETILFSEYEVGAGKFSEEDFKEVLEHLSTKLDKVDTFVYLNN